MMRRILAIVMAAAAAIMLHAQTAEEGYNLTYKITVPAKPEYDGAMLYLANYDQVAHGETAEKLDSAVVKDGYAYFTGSIDEPIPAFISFNGKNLGVFVLESGAFSVDIDKHIASGTMLNDVMRQYSEYGEELMGRYREADEAGREAILGQYVDYLRGLVADNSDNPVGYFALEENSYLFPAEEIVGMLDAHPDLMAYAGMKELKRTAERKLATSAGCRYADFEVTYDGMTYRLSDYAERGKYLLVDFWASWCGPCRREIGLLKRLYPEYKDKVDFLGVAVWDDPADTLEAINQLGIPWECIINAQTEPTDLYGIQGIPCIMLISPDGTIIFRDLQDEELEEALRQAVGNHE